MAILPAQDIERLHPFGLKAELAPESAWAIEPSGTRHRGAAGLLIALDWALGWSLFRRLYGIGPVAAIAEATYTLIARWRHRLPGLKPYCLEYPERCAPITPSESPPEA